ncbi:MAG: HlyC/CorC family transporter [Bacteroidales bacterium]|nr:HlyC/CorC family transporter [Bacteroidales bacterium]
MVNVFLIVSMLIFSAFFSAGEMAFLSSNKLMLEINRKRHPHFSRIIDIFNANASTLIAVILVGNNIAMVVYGLAFGEEFAQFCNFSSDALTLLAQTLVSTFIIIIVAEFLPKALIQTNPSAMLNVFSMPLMFFYIVFYPIGRSMQWLADMIIKGLLPTRKTEDVDKQVGRFDLDKLLRTQSDDSHESNSPISQEAKLMRNTLDFAKIKVRDCAIPRTEIVAVDVNEPVSELHKQFIETGFSKILVYDDTIDNIIGFVHVSAEFHQAKSIRAMMSPIAIVPETMGANKLLKLFTSQHKSIALVVDEFGGTAGMITLEDVLEEIFGEINDEHDVAEYVEKQLGEGDYIFSGRLEIDYINDKYHLELPSDDDYDTIAGLILHTTQSIPDSNDEIDIDKFHFRILMASHTKIEKVRLTITK